MKRPELGGGGDARAARGAFRLALLVLLLLGLLGTGAELLMIGHNEGLWQLVPLILIAAGLVLAARSTLQGRRAILGAFQGAMTPSWPRPWTRRGGRSST